MDVWNPGKNRWRYKEGSDEKIIEIELTKGQIALIDSDRLEEVAKHRWSTTKNYNMYYAHTSIKKPKEKQTTIAMHVLLFPDIIAPRDHIDRNGTNNTSSNLRSGVHGINERNRYTKKPDIGISQKGKAFRAVWTNSVGKMYSRNFHWSNYPSIDDAYKAAVACRVENSELAISEITVAQQQKRPIEPTLPPESDAKFKNLCVLRKNGEFYRVKAAVMVDKKRILKYFSAFKFDNDLEKATAAANEWIEEMRIQQKKRRIEKIDE